jgi:hypothetical protein
MGSYELNSQLVQPHHEDALALALAQTRLLRRQRPVPLGQLLAQRRQRVPLVLHLTRVRLAAALQAGIRKQILKTKISSQFQIQGFETVETRRFQAPR